MPTPIIALTAHALQGDRERLLAEGFDGYVSKPVDIELLSRELQRVPGGKRKFFYTTLSPYFNI